MLSRRTFDEMRIELGSLSAKDMSQLKGLLRHHGSTVTKLELKISGLNEITESDFIQILNFFPSLTELKLRVWERSLVKEKMKTEDFLRLFSLQKVNFFGSQTVLVIFTQSLPRHVITELTYSGKQLYFHIWNNFISTQLSIKKLDLDSNFCHALPFTNLQLTHFRIVFRYRFSMQNQNFMKNIIASQKQLTNLDVFCISRDKNWKVNDDILTELSQLQSLEVLKLNIDKIKAWKVQFISNFRKLKELEIDAMNEKSLSTIVKLSLMNNVEIEKLK